MKKRALAILLSAAMVFGLTACGGQSSDANQNAAPDAAAGTEAAAPAEEGGDAAAGDAAAPATDTYFDELKHLVVSFPTFTGAHPDTELVVEEVNKILREKYNIEVEFQIGDVGSYNQNATLALSSGEQIDVMSTLFLTYANLANQGYFIDLEADGLLANYGQGITGVIEKEYLDTTRIGGVLYGITNTRDYAVGRGGIGIGTEYLDAIGYQKPADAGEIVPLTQAELDDIFAKLHEKFPDITVYGPATSDLMQQTVVDQLGGNNFGVLMADQSELKVINLFESEEYMNFCKRIYGWNQLGYVSKDAVTDPPQTKTQEKDGVLLAYGTGGKPGIKSQEDIGCNRDMTIFQLGQDVIASSSVSGFPWVIPITTADSKAAMILLNELYTNHELADLIIYGIKDKHYTITEDGLLQPNPDAYSTLNWAYPNQYASTVTVGNPPDVWEQTDKFNKEAVKSPALGFSFDQAPVANEITAVTNVYTEYQNALEFGFLDPEVAIPEMNEKLMAAGLQKIIDEKQKQLDAWAATKQ